MQWSEVRLPAYLLLLTGAAAPLVAQPAWPSADVRRATLSFDGKSTLGDFTGTTTEVRGQMTGGASMADVRGWVEAPVKSLKTGNDRRDRDLVKTMEADIFPNIRFELERVLVEWERADSAGVVLEGKFVLHGVSRPERLRATVRRSAEGTRVTTTHPMNLHDYKIDKLTRFLVIKMKPDILVHVDVEF
jgi:polyisoprenoid-binding protein YceI